MVGKDITVHHNFMSDRFSCYLKNCNKNHKLSKLSRLHSGSMSRRAVFLKTHTVHWPQISQGFGVLLDCLPLLLKNGNALWRVESDFCYCSAPCHFKVMPKQFGDDGKSHSENTVI